MKQTLGRNRVWVGSAIPKWGLGLAFTLIELLVVTTIITVEFPFQPSRRWQQSFIKIKKPHLCFHCLRVTYVNRLRRAGVPREAAMRPANHASELIHQTYQREKVEVVAQWRDAVSFPAEKGG